MGLARNLGLALAGIAIWASGHRAEAGAPAYLQNGTDVPFRVVFDLRAFLKAPVTLVEVDLATGAESGEPLLVDFEPALQIDTPPSKILTPGKALRITMDHPAGTKFKFPMWIEGRDGARMDDWQYSFQFTSDLTQAEPKVVLKEYFCSPDFKLPFGMQELSGSELKLVPRGGEAKTAPSTEVRTLKSKAGGSSCAIL